MARATTYLTLICKNINCPKPKREFTVTYSFRNREYCGRQCFQAGYTAERAALAKANPALTARQFDEITLNIKMSRALKEGVRKVLVKGWLIKDAVLASGCTQQSISKAVARCRNAAT